MSNNSSEHSYKPDQSRWEMYYNFEDIVAKESDENIRKCLSSFLPEDFLSMPIVFDLVSYKKLSLLKSLYKDNMPLTYQDEYGSTALHVACGAAGSLDCVTFLIENSILTDINKRCTKYGDTPLTLAICYGHQDILSFFKERYGVNSISFQDLDVILDRIISRQVRNSTLPRST